MVIHSNIISGIGLRDLAAWQFKPSGDYEADCAAGRSLAEQYLALRLDPAFSPALGWIVSSISQLERDLSGLEIGFFQAVSENLLPTMQPAKAMARVSLAACQ